MDAPGLVDFALRALVFAPRPTADLLSMAAPSASSGLPSTFGLVYGALFGALLYTAPNRSVATAATIAALTYLAMFVGTGARVVLGGYWASPIISSLCVGIALAAVVKIASNARIGAHQIGRRE